MGLLNWIVGLGRRGSNTPLSFYEWLATPPPKIAAAINRHLDREIARRRGSNPPAPGNKPAAPAGPPAKPRPTGGRLIYVDRDPGPVQPRLPDDLADLPVLTADVPSDQQMERWKRAAIAEYQQGGEPTWRTSARLAFAEGQQQAQSLQIPPPGADPVATDGDLLNVWIPPCTYDDARRAIYNHGRADERTAILRALGVEP